MATPKSREPEPVLTRPPLAMTELICRWRLLSSRTWLLKVGAPTSMTKRAAPLRSSVPWLINAKPATLFEVVVMPPVSVNRVPRFTVMYWSVSYCQPPLVFITRPARVFVPARLTVPAALVVMTLRGSMTPPRRWVKSAAERVSPPAGR